jgi:DNA polymerase I-like protein with 3'-5' exonuclease and polymerase domains
MVSYSLMVGESSPVFKYYLDPDYTSYIGRSLDDATDLVGFHIKFDLHWLTNLAASADFQRVRIWDCQLAEFIYSGQENRFASLNETLEKYDLPTKKDLVAEYWAAGVSTEKIPVSILEEYNNWDVYTTKMLFDVQQNLLSEKQKRLVYLAGEDLKTLQAAEYAGVKFDTAKADEKLSILTSEIESINDLIYKYLPDGIPQGTFNIDSGDHLSALLYGGTISFDWYTEKPAVYKTGAKAGISYVARSWHTTAITFDQRFKPLEGSEVAKTIKNPSASTRFYQTDAPTLAQLRTRNKDDKRLLELITVRSGKAKVAEMIVSFKAKIAAMNWQDDYIHGQFNQNVVITGRLSSSSPNMQNTPIEVDELLVSRYAD